LDFDIKEYSQHISDINGVENVHHLHVWNLDEEHIVATVHIKIADEFFPEKYSEVKEAVTEASHEYGINHITVQVDTASCSCDNHCETY
jgi:Co/Zn/Cd efflux system component